MRADVRVARPQTVLPALLSPQPRVAEAAQSIVQRITSERPRRSQPLSPRGCIGSIALLRKRAALTRLRSAKGSLATAAACHEHSSALAWLLTLFPPVACCLRARAGVARVARARLRRPQAAAVAAGRASSRACTCGGATLSTNAKGAATPCECLLAAHRLFWTLCDQRLG
eukprot:5747102-Pleurochrysis_carterae.AAC.2